MEREVGGGIGMGNTCKPLAVSFQCMTKSTTNKKKKKKKRRSLVNPVLWCLCSDTEIPGVHRKEGRWGTPSLKDQGH